MASAGLLLAFGVPFLLSLALTAALRSLAPRWGLVDEPSGRKAHARVMPLGGGIAIALSLVSCALAFRLLPDSEILEGLRLRTPDLGWVALAAALVFVLGLADDLRDLGPGIKLGVQLAAAGMVAVLVPESRLSVLGSVPAARIVLTVLWIVALTNAFNFLDNMDGLAAGVAAVAAVLLTAIALTEGRLLMAAWFLGLLGALGGFLVFNAPPASIFLGDAGSLLVGFLLAVGSVLFTYETEPDSLRPVAVPLLVFGVPLFDAVTVMGIRLKEGRPLSQGDASHFSHRLVALGMSPREAVGTLWLLSFVAGMGALLTYHVPDEAVPLLLLQGLGAFSVVALLERAARRRR